jgi:hypothetical protein
LQHAGVYESQNSLVSVSCIGRIYGFDRALHANRGRNGREATIPRNPVFVPPWASQYYSTCLFGTYWRVRKLQVASCLKLHRYNKWF